jgi:hypothetical protein
MNTWTRVITFPNGERRTDVGDIDGDFFAGVLGNGLAKVAMTVGFGLAYGEAKVSATVSLTCNQDEKTINAVGERAFYKAHELAGDGLNLISEEIKKNMQGNP